MTTILRVKVRADLHLFTTFFINENVGDIGAKATAMINLVQQLKSDGVPIDGIGLQCHFIVGEVPTTFQSNLEAMTALGVEVSRTDIIL